MRIPERINSLRAVTELICLPAEAGSTRHYWACGLSGNRILLAVDWHCLYGGNSWP